jgi:predicted membrane protein
MHCNRSHLSMTLILGLVIIAAGTVALLSNLNVIRDVDVWDWWPVILILIGFDKIFKPREYRQFYSGLVWILFGVLFLLNTLYVLDFNFWEIWPVAIILIGLAIIRHGFFPGRHMPLGGSKNYSKDIDFIDITTVVGGGEHGFNSQKLTGGRITTVMGGTEVDLRNADMEGDSLVLDTLTVMGGTEIYIPTDWEVIFQGVPVLGSFENKTRKRIPANDSAGKKKKAKQLIVKGTTIMGGLEVKN